jgi:calcineurin-like phosphoesterase family protein
MTDVRYLVISDLHLGASNSILTKLTPDLKGTIPHEPSDLLRQYVECLLQIVSANASAQPVTLILNGDFLELALAGMNESAMVFENFISLLMSDPRSRRISPRILCLAGNHDHHLWNAARETRYTTRYVAKTPPGEYLEQESYVTAMVEKPSLQKIPLDFLNALIQRLPHLDGLSFETVYPNYALLNAEKTRCVVIHHGHFIESIYSLMTSLKDALFPERDPILTLSELEAENGAWIDFFWSTLGRSGQVGADVELIYDKMQDPPQLEALFGNLALEMAGALPPRWRWTGSLKASILAVALRRFLGGVAKREVHETGNALSPDADAGLTRYLGDFLLAAIRAENDGTLPPELTFIFGHTHKPFEMLRRVDGVAQEIQVLNSGGWVVDTLRPDPLHGAAIILVDDELNSASIRLYNESDSDQGRAVSILSANDQNPLVAGLKSRLDLQAPCWKTMPEAALAAVRDHRQNLHFKVDEK